MLDREKGKILVQLSEALGEEVKQLEDMQRKGNKEGFENSKKKILEFYTKIKEI